jgi:hypothetical protein
MIQIIRISIFCEGQPVNQIFSLKNIVILFYYCKNTSGETPQNQMSIL